MLTRSRRLAALVRLAAAMALLLAVATPASAQFGGLKKKLKSATASEAASKATEAAVPEAAAPAGPAAPAGGTGGTIVLDEKAVSQLIAGLEAGRAERDRAAAEDTPYGRHRKAVAAYAVAHPKCQAAQQTFPQRMAGNQKLSDQYSAMVDKMVAAQGNGDQKLYAVYADSAMAMQDPSCTIKEPHQPDDYYEAQRAADNRAEQQEMKVSGFSRSELAMVKERTEAILRGADAPGDASQSERTAVKAHEAKLKPLLGINPPPAPPAPAAVAPTPAAPPPPTASPAATAMNRCVISNSQKHQKEIEALSSRAEAAQAANNMEAVMAIADTLQQLPDGRLHSGPIVMATAFRSAAAVALSALVAAGALGAGSAREDAGTGDALAVRDASGWTTWWRRDAAPAKWEGDALAARIAWRAGSPGVEWGELLLKGSSEAWRTRVIVARIDTRQVDLALTTAFTEDRRWTAADADTGSVLALDAGQFRGDLPWGWVLTGGRELLAPAVRAAGGRGGGGPVGIGASGVARQRGGRAGARRRARGVPELSDAAAGWRGAEGAARGGTGREPGASRCPARARHGSRWAGDRRAHAVRCVGRRAGPRALRPDLTRDGSGDGRARRTAGHSAGRGFVRTADGPGSRR